MVVVMVRELLIMRCLEVDEQGVFISQDRHYRGHTASH